MNIIAYGVWCDALVVQQKCMSVYTRLVVQSLLACTHTMLCCYLQVVMQPQQQREQQQRQQEGQQQQQQEQQQQQQQQRQLPGWLPVAELAGFFDNADPTDPFTLYGTNL
jgi:hypothetical protein